MSIIDTLITDRSEADLSAIRALLAIPFDKWTAEQKEQFNLAVSKGAYNASDLNRVNDACLYLAGKFREYGYQVDVKLPTVIGQTKVPALPEGYTQVEYIESTGTQYVDTGFTPNQDTRVTMKVLFLATDSAYRHFCGARIAAGNSAFVIWAYGSNFRFDYANVSNQATSGSELVAGEIINLDADKNTLYINGTATVTHTTATFSTEYNFWLFALNSGGSMMGTYEQANCRMYSCQIYDNGTLIRDYIPCIDPDGVAGLYDAVNGVFYGDAAGGAFTVGDTVTENVATITQTTTRNYWKVGDKPRKDHMEQYLQNVQDLRSVFEVAAGTPAVPDDMKSLTIEEANDIELILLAVNTVLTRVFAAFLRSGQFTFWSGNRPLPTGNTDLGRTWAELDAMNTTWANWQVATWYLLSYGDLKAEGTVT